VNPSRPAARVWESGGGFTMLLRWLGAAEDVLLVVLLAVMIGLAAWQIVARNMLDTAIIWGDPLLRTLVLWVGFLGAVAAVKLRAQRDGREGQAAADGLLERADAPVAGRLGQADVIGELHVADAPVPLQRLEDFLVVSVEFHGEFLRRNDSNSKKMPLLTRFVTKNASGHRFTAGNVRA